MIYDYSIFFFRVNRLSSKIQSNINLTNDISKCLLHIIAYKINPEYHKTKILYAIVPLRHCAVIHIFVF